MSLYRVADLITAKYKLQSQAASLAEIVDQVKRDLINVYRINVSSAKDPVLRMLADGGEPFSKELLGELEDIVGNIDGLTLVQLFNRVNKVLGLIRDMRADPTNTVRETIHSMVRVTKESERNYREHVKSKFEKAISSISFVFEKQAKILRKFTPKEVALEGGAIDPQRKELSKEKLLIFMRTPSARRFGLDNIDVMTKILAYPELRQKVTTLVNAIDRGHMPADGPEVAAETAAIMFAFKNKRTNEQALESGVDTEQEQTRLKMIQNRNDEKFNKIKSLDNDPAFMAEQKRLEDERKQREIEQDRERLIKKYESVTNFEQWMKKGQL